MFATAVRIRAWSSITTTRSRSGDMFVLRDRERGRVPRQHDLGTRPRGGDDGQRGADALGALVHAGEAETDALALVGDAAALVGGGATEVDGANGRWVQADGARSGVGPGVGGRVLAAARDLVYEAAAECRQVRD